MLTAREAVVPLTAIETTPAGFHCCGGTSGAGNDHDDAIAIGVLVVGALVLGVVGWGLFRFMSWRSSRRSGPEDG